MRKTFFISLLALCLTASAWAVEVNDLAGLQAALANGGEITLTADISTDVTLNVTKGITLNGAGHYVKGAAQQYVFKVTTAEAVSFENVVIYAAKVTTGRGIHVNVSNANVTLEGVTINAQERGVDVFISGNVLNGVTLTVNNSTIQNVNSAYGITMAENGNPSDPSVYNTKTINVSGDIARGINVGRLTNSNITVTNSTIQGFPYNINVISGTMAGSTITATNTTFKGRAAMNIWSSNQGGTYVADNCHITGINNFGGSQEGFASFVIYNSGNTLTITNGTDAAAVFDATGAANVNARQYLVADRGGNNTITINDASFTCTKELGDTKGGVFEQVRAGSDIEINGGTYDCPNIVQATYSDVNGNTANIEINGGTFETGVVSPDMTDGDVYKTVEITGGVYSADISVSDPADPTNTLVVAGKAPFIRPDEMYEPLIADYVRPLRENIVFGTICLPKDGKLYGATLYEPAYKSGSMIFFAEVNSDDIEGGKAYLFKANEGYSTIAAKYDNPANSDAALQNNGAMIGAYEQTHINYTLGDYAIVRDNKYYRVNSDNVYVGANCAYIDMNQISDNVAPVPGRRYISFQDASANQVTALENVEAAENAGVQKVMVDGQLYIIRGEQIYNVAGQVVK